MDIHKNARATPCGQFLMIRHLAEGWTVAAAFGVGPRTVYKWRSRHAKEGEAGLVERSSRPLRSGGGSVHGIGPDTNLGTDPMAPAFYVNFSRSGRPRVSGNRSRLRPRTFFPASKPRGPPASVVLTA